jgi:hypothetical protein
MIWPNDRSRCTGDGCIHRNSCARHAAHMAVLDQQAASHVYIDFRAYIEGVIENHNGGNRCKK